MRHLSQIKESIKAKARQLGFTHVGISAALPVPHYQEFLDWVSAGYHVEMGYLARPDTLAKRADPGLILPKCQRVICLAMPYAPPQAELSETPPGHGRISAYARTADYHEIIQEKLRELESFIHTRTEEAVGVKSYVDTGPVLERAYANQAGIGMPGKNTNLIIPGSGSYFFLAEVLTDLALPVDAPFTRDLCGSCQRCIEACPTACILPDRTIDASRCISYLTIENKGVIPDELKTQVGSWFFGCDICQMVCPHNARGHTQSNSLGETHLPEFIDVIDLLTRDQAAFTAAFNNTALTRAKRRGLLRNAAVVLGNQRDQTALPRLNDLLARETDPIIRDACAWAVNQIEGSG